jgi:hypothetical protein
MIRNMETPQRVRDVLAGCAEQHGVHVGAMTAKTREAAVVAARRAAVKILSDEGHSTPAIGRYLGGMHHTSVRHLLITAGPPKRRYNFPIPQIRVGDGLEDDIRIRLAEVAVHRKVLHGKLAELDDLERKMLAMLETLKPERVV